MPHSIAIIPEDSTISFLTPLKDLFEEIGVEIITFTKDEDSISETKKVLANDELSNVFYLGHGASYEFQGPDESTFMNIGDLQLLKGKSVFALACRSEEYLGNCSEDISYIGFGNLPTEWSYVQALRDYEDPYAYETLTEELVNLFSKELCNVVKSAIKDASENNFDLKLVYNKLILHFNKIITETLVKRNIEGYREFVDFLYEVKREMKINLV